MVNDKFEKFVDQLQQDIVDDALETYGEKAVSHWLNPHNTMIFSDPDGRGRVTGNCGDTMEMGIKVNDAGQIAEIYFTTDGCGASGLCGSVVSSMAKDKSLEEAEKINQGVVLEYLGGLPEEEEHCANLASLTLKAAIDDFRSRK